MSEGRIWAESLSCDSDLEEVKRQVWEKAVEVAPDGTPLSEATVEEDTGQMGSSACPVCNSPRPGKYVSVSELLSARSERPEVSKSEIAARSGGGVDSPNDLKMEAQPDPIPSKVGLPADSSSPSDPPRWTDPVRWIPKKVVEGIYGSDSCGHSEIDGRGQVLELAPLRFAAEGKRIRVVYYLESQSSRANSDEDTSPGRTQTGEGVSSAALKAHPSSDAIRGDADPYSARFSHDSECYVESDNEGDWCSKHGRAITECVAELRKAKDEAYLDRNLLAIAFARACDEMDIPGTEFGNLDVWTAVDPSAPGYLVLYVETRQGQVSWHIPEAMLSDNQFGRRPASDWDGHDTAEKRRRLEAFRL